MTCLINKLKEIQKKTKDHRLHDIRRRELEIVHRSHPLDGRNQVLDVGCGDAYQSYLWAQLVAEVVPTDFTTDRLERRIPNFVLCSATHLPFQTNSFDVIFSSHVLEHIGDRRSFLLEQRRVCKDGGLIIIIVPTSFWKSIQLLTHYLDFVYRGFLGIIIASRKQSVSQKRKTMTECLSRILPKTHGEFKSNKEEILFYKSESWLNFLRNFFVCEIQIISTFPFSPLEFTVLPRTHFLGKPASSFIFIIRNC